MASRLETAPEPVRRLSGIASPDYADGYEAGPTRFDAAAVDPAGWARKVFEAQPAPLRALLRLGWRFPLGLHLAPEHLDDHVLGWRIAGSGPGWVRITARSRLLESTQVFYSDGDKLFQSTFVRFETGLGRRVWAITAPVHRRLMPVLLDRAVR